MFSESEQKYLLSVARRSIETAVSGKTREIIENAPPELCKPRGAFVTIHIGDQLRGCIGYIDAVGSLVDTVQEAAEKAALQDYRFNPVSREEVPKIIIEISVISPMRLIHDINEIKIGKHGLMIVHGYNRGLLLPQVATEQGWNRETFLSQTARKAGLPATAWKDPEAKIYCFSAEILKEQ